MPVLGPSQPEATGSLRPRLVTGPSSAIMCEGPAHDGPRPAGPGRVLAEGHGVQRLRGSGICPHGRRKGGRGECGGSGICPNWRRKSRRTSGEWGAACHRPCPAGGNKSASSRHCAAPALAQAVVGASAEGQSGSCSCLTRCSHQRGSSVIGAPFGRPPMLRCRGCPS